MKQTKFTEKQTDEVFKENAILLPVAKTWGIPLKTAVGIFGKDVIENVCKKSIKPKQRLSNKKMTEALLHENFFVERWKNGKMDAQDVCFNTVSMAIDGNYQRKPKAELIRDRQRDFYLFQDHGERIVKQGEEWFLTYTGTLVARDHFNYTLRKKVKAQADKNT